MVIASPRKIYIVLIVARKGLKWARRTSLLFTKPQIMPHAIPAQNPANKPPLVATKIVLATTEDSPAIDPIDMSIMPDINKNAIPIAHKPVKELALKITIIFSSARNCGF